MKWLDNDGGHRPPLQAKTTFAEVSERVAELKSAMVSDTQSVQIIESQSGGVAYADPPANFSHD